jgi:hypothetical protein
MVANPRGGPRDHDARALCSRMCMCVRGVWARAFIPRPPDRARRGRSFGGGSTDRISFDLCTPWLAPGTRGGSGAQRPRQRAPAAARAGRGTAWECEAWREGAAAVAPPGLDVCVLPVECGGKRLSRHSRGKSHQPSLTTAINDPALRIRPRPPAAAAPGCFFAFVLVLWVMGAHHPNSARAWRSEKLTQHHFGFTLLYFAFVAPL